MFSRYKYSRNDKKKPVQVARLAFGDRTDTIEIKTYYMDAGKSVERDGLPHHTRTNPHLIAAGGETA